MRTTDLAVSAGLVFADARRHDLPDPIDLKIGRSGPDPVVVHLDNLADLAQWAQWAEATLTSGDPKPHIADRWTVIHEARGSIAELEVLLVAVEIGRMFEADSFECPACGAMFGQSGGFVAIDAPVDDSFEVEVARHQDGACVGAAVTR